MSRRRINGQGKHTSGSYQSTVAAVLLVLSISFLPAEKLMAKSFKATDTHSAPADEAL